jgi:hypothetical protein
VLPRCKKNYFLLHVRHREANYSQPIFFCDRPRRPHVGGLGGNPSLRRAAFTPRPSPASSSPEHAAGKAARRWDGDRGALLPDGVVAS